MYVPSIGFCIGLAHFFGYLVYGKGKRKFFSLVSSAIAITLSLYAYQTWLRNYDWFDNMTIFRKAVESYPENARMQHIYGLEVWNIEKNATKAIEIHKKSLEIYPDFNEAHAYIGRIYFSIGDNENAYHHFSRCSDIGDNHLLTWFVGSKFS